MFCSNHLIKQHEQGHLPRTLPPSEWISTAFLLQTSPLQPSGTISSPLSRSNNLPLLSNAITSRSFQDETPPGVPITSRHFPSGGTTVVPDSDDALWGGVPEPTEEDITLVDKEYLRTTNSESDSVFPSPIISTPPPSQRAAPVPCVASIASDSASHISIRSTTTDRTLSATPSPDPALLQKPYYNALTRALRDVFSLPSFRPNQLAAISAFMDGKDVFVLMPTGGGKSLCFQLPAVIKHQQHKLVTFVVTPLISLMSDQVRALQSKGVHVVQLKGDQELNERMTLLADLMSD